jgi:hypothetical protein
MMGEQDVDQVVDEHQQRVFMKALLDDLRALEQMLETGMVESGVRRIGAEQEMFLVDSNLGPAAVAEKVLGRLDDARFVAVVARFKALSKTPSCPKVFILPKKSGGQKKSSELSCTRIRCLTLCTRTPKGGWRSAASSLYANYVVM